MSFNTTLADAVTGTGAQTAVDTHQEGRFQSGMKCVQATGKTTSGAGAVAVDIEASNDALAYVRLATISLTLSTSYATDGFAFDAPWKYMRANVTSISGTGAFVTVTMAD